MTKHGWLYTLAALAFCPAIASAQLPTGFTDELYLNTLNSPVAISFRPDDQMLVVEKGGVVQQINAALQPATTAPYLSIADIDTDGERGLLDLTFDPNFAQNGYLYVYYSNATEERFRIARFQDVSGIVDPLSETTIWQDNEDFTGTAHLGGGLDFGPDGCLYLTTGDEFEAAQAPNLARAGGKVIRIHRDGSIPIDNPFVDGPGGNLDEIWAYGMRNPFRARWDLETERFFVAEVGGNTSVSWEDIHLVTSGANLGWPTCEGPCLNPDFPNCICGVHDDPIFGYDHSLGGAAVIGGVVYRGNQFPSGYNGAYFYGDYVRGELSYLTFDVDGAVTGSTLLVDDAGPIVAIEQGPDGSLYYARIDGQVRRIQYNNGNQAPIITQAEATTESGPVPLIVSFFGAATDQENDPLTYKWRFGDGAEANVPAPTHTYQSNGMYEAQFEVSDAGHTVLSDSVVIRVGALPNVEITAPVDGAVFRAGDVIPFSAVATDADGQPSELTIEWNVKFVHNEHTHPAIDLYAGAAGSLFIPDRGHDFSDDTGFRLVARVVDADGLVHTDRVTIYPDKVDLLFDTVPSGLTVMLDDRPRTTPFVHDTLIGFQHEVQANHVLCATQPGLVFDQWSDGGAATHTVTVPEADAAYFAEYLPGSTGDCNGNQLADTCELREPRTALFLDGNDDIIDIPDQSLGDFTLETWILLTGKIDREDGLVGQGGFGQDINFAGRRFRVFAPGDAIVAATQHPADTWVHYALTRTGTDLTLYVNGVFDATGTLTDPFTPKVIGRGTASEGSIFGSLDEFRLWDYARSATEIADNYQYPIAPGTPGLLLYYSFNDDVDSQTILDASGLGNHGTRGLTVISDFDDPVHILSSAPLLGSADCNGNGIPDECEPDSDADGLIDGCDQFGDVNLDGIVDAADLPGILACMDGPDLAPAPQPPLDTNTCLRDTDVDFDIDVDLHDLAQIQANIP